MQTANEFLESGLLALDLALRQPGNDFRNLQLATLSPGGRPDVRTVVLRGFDRSPPCLEIHSDARAGKVRDIGASRRVTVLAWSAAEQTQLRFEGEASLHRGDALARRRWDALSGKARRPYGLQAAAGAPVGDPESQAHLPEAQRFEQFVVIRVALDRIDMLRLYPEGRQLRVTGRLGPDRLTAEWVGP